MDPEVAARLIHSANERVPVDDVELGLRCLLHARRAPSVLSSSSRSRSSRRSARRSARRAPSVVSSRTARTRRAKRRAVPPRAVPLPLLAPVRDARVESRHAARFGSASGRGPGATTTTPRRSRQVRAAIARGDVYQVNLVQHLSAPFAGDRRARSPARSARCTRGRSSATAGRSSRRRPSSSSRGAATGSGRSRSRARARSARTSTTPRTPPST